MQSLQAGRVLRSSGLRLTGRTVKLQSALTGLWTTYRETLSIHVSSLAPTVPDLDALKEKISNDLYTGSVDGFCDEVLFMRGVFQDTYKPRVWIAEEQSTLLHKHPRLIAPIIIAAIIFAAGIIVAAIAFVVAVSILASSFTTVAGWILQPPSYVGGTPDEPEVYDSWAEYLSSQHNLYWYVCPKCGAGFGLKLDYANIEDVPQAEVDAYYDHVEICLGIPKGPQRVEEFLVWAVIGVAGGVAILWILKDVLVGGQKILVAPRE